MIDDNTNKSSDDSNIPQHPPGLPPKQWRYENIDEDDEMAELKKLQIDALYEKTEMLAREDNNANEANKPHVTCMVAKRLERYGWDARSDFFFIENGDQYEPIYHKNLDQTLSGGERIIPAPTTTNLFFGMDIDTFSLSENDEDTVTAFIDNQNVKGIRPANALANWWISRQPRADTERA